jgi:chemotaxis signal transduction protein
MDSVIDNAGISNATAQFEPPTSDQLTLRAQNHTAQAIYCGGWSLAFSMTWANVIIDNFEIVKIPRAPVWLVGAVNLEGNIIPVVDMSVYFVPNAIPMVAERHLRLLVGGRRDEKNESMSGSVNENVFAVLFSGLPMQIEYDRQAIDSFVVIPERLREMCLGVASTESGKSYFEMDTDKLLDYLSMNLI